MGSEHGRDSLGKLQFFGNHHLCFGLLWALSLVAFWRPLRLLAELVWRDERYTHIAFIPVISLGLICWGQSEIFQETRRAGLPSLLTAALSAIIYGVAEWMPSTQNDVGGLWLEVLALVLMWVAGFLFAYGTSAFRLALPALSMLLLFLPAPPFVVEVAQAVLQRGSAEVTSVLFQLTATPVFRDGMAFFLPGLTIEVARECSGFRSNIALVIAALVLAQVFLRSNWNKAFLVVLSIPIAIFKNAARITTLSWLGAFVSRDFLYGDLHRQGGTPFSLLALALTTLLLIYLMRVEARRKEAQRPDPPAGEAETLDG